MELRTLGISKAMGGPGLDWKTVGQYAGVQSAAGIAAAICYTLLLLGPEICSASAPVSLSSRGSARASTSPRPRVSLGTMPDFARASDGKTKSRAREWNKKSNMLHSPETGSAPAQALQGEMLYTFMLTFVVMNVAAAKKNVSEKNQYYGMAIAFTVLAGAYGAGAVSGGCFNPAVALGIDVSSAGVGFGWCVPYILFELLGSAMAAALFKVVRPEDWGREEPGDRAGQRVPGHLHAGFDRRPQRFGELKGCCLLHRSQLDLHDLCFGRCVGCSLQPGGHDGHLCLWPLP